MMTGLFFRGAVPALVAVATSTAPAAANAAVYLFTLTGPATANFSLDSSPTPSVTNTTDGFFGLSNVAGTLNGSPTTFGEINFFLSAPNGGGFDAITDSTTLSLNGPQLFTGDLATPVFMLGTFDLSPTAFGINQPPGAYSITISEVSGSVPEPASWGMMLLGFGAVGVAMRRSKGAKATFRRAA